MPQESILFGSIAVALGKVTADQLRRGLELQQEWARIGVRKPIGEILKEQGHLDDRGIREVLHAQAYKEKRLESRDYGRIARECGFVSADRTEEALRAQKEAYRGGHGLVSLGRILLDRGWIESQQHASVMRALNRIHGREGTVASTTSVLYGVKECPGCFEFIDFRAERCDRCNIFLGEVTVRPECPACHQAQEPGGEFCAHCGANLVTGRQPSTRRDTPCGECGALLADGQEQCYRCGTRRPAPPLRRAAGWLVAHAAPIVGSAAGKILLAALLLGLGVALFHLPEIGRAARAVMLGADRTRLDRALSDLCAALVYADDRGVRAVMDPAWVVAPAAADETAVAARDRLFRAVLHAPSSMEEIVVASAEVEQSRIEGDEAVAYVRVEARIRTSREADPEAALAELWASVQGSTSEGGGRGHVRRRLTWRWGRHGDRWVLREK